MKKIHYGIKTLRENKRQGMTMIFALCATALLLAFTLSVLYIGSALLATANRKAITERCYQKAMSFSSVVENQLTAADPNSLQTTIANRLDRYLEAAGVEAEFSFDYAVENENMTVSFKTVPAADTTKTRVVKVYVTTREKGEQQTVITKLNYNSGWSPKFQPTFIEGN